MKESSTDDVGKVVMLNTGRIFRILEVSSMKELAGQFLIEDLPLCKGFYHSGFLYLNDSQSSEGPRKFAVMKVKGLPGPGRHEVDQIGSLSLPLGAAGISEKIHELHYLEPQSKAIIRIDGPEHCCPLCA